jgi:SAM-dependent methyltransferase
MFEESPTSSFAEAGGRQVHTQQLPLKYNQIAAHVQSFLNGLESRVPNEHTYHLGRFYSRRETPNIDYDRYAPAFTFSYFLENYWKAGSVFEARHPAFSHTVIDIGCGSGATSLGYLTSLDNAVPVGAIWSVSLLLIDHSEVQLQLAKQLIEAVKDDLNRLNISVEERCADFQGLEIPAGTVDCLLLGHVLNENQSDLCLFLEKACAASAGGGQIYVIERIDDSVWGKIVAGVNKFAMPYVVGTTGVRTRDLEKHRSRRLAEKEHLYTKYLLADVPQNKSHAKLLRRYFEAWERQDPSLLPQIFTKNAEYHDKPFKRPRKGLGEIKEYWLKQVCRQTDVSTKVLSTAYTRDGVFVEWKANFSLGGRRVEVRGAMILLIEADTGLVHTLREYFRSQETPPS